MLEYDVNGKYIIVSGGNLDNKEIIYGTDKNDVFDIYDGTDFDLYGGKVKDIFKIEYILNLSIKDFDPNDDKIFLGLT